MFKENEDAEGLFEDIKDCIKLPGIQETYSEIEGKIPEDKTTFGQEYLWTLLMKPSH